MVRSRVELFEQIRRDWRAGEVSIRELAVRHHVHRRTVRQALASAVPPLRKAYPPRPRPALDPYTRGSTSGCWLTGTCPASSAIPPGGSGSGWSPGTARAWRR
jgi:hypothetical protein